jgi:hypothetical protein
MTIAAKIFNKTTSTNMKKFIDENVPPHKRLSIVYRP